MRSDMVWELGIPGVMNQEAASGEGNLELKLNSKQSSNPTRPGGGGSLEPSAKGFSN